MALAKNKNIQDTYLHEIHSLLGLMTHIFCVVDESGIFGGRNFMLSEAYENLTDSHALIKLGYFKHAYASLRMARDCALYSIYYSE